MALRTKPAHRCFIAMAFGRRDTDKLYKDVLYKILRSHNVAPIRLDRIEHNDDINVRMLQEIDSAHFAIADLTYSRPSVYYEAGYAQRKIPVIYTARDDHFGGKAPDGSDTHRVHFDLRMKNIIRWRTPDDRQFATRLERRIAEEVAKLRGVAKVNEDTIEEQQEFLSRSADARRESIHDTCIEALGALDFEQAGDDAFIRTTSQTAHYITLDFLRSGKSPSPLASPYPAYNLNFNGVLSLLRELRETRILCSLSKIDFDHLCFENSDWRPNLKRKALYREESLNIPVFPVTDIGDVYIDHALNFLGHQKELGFSVRSAPWSMDTARSSRKGFVIAKAHTRTISRKLRAQLFDNIDSLNPFSESFRKFLKQPF